MSNEMALVVAEILAASMMAVTMIWMSKFDIGPMLKILVYLASSIVFYETIGMAGFAIFGLQQDTIIHISAVAACLVGMMGVDIITSPWLDATFPKAYGPQAFRTAKVKSGPMKKMDMTMTLLPS